MQEKVLKSLCHRKKENEVNNANMGYSKSITVSQPKAVTVGQGSSRQESGTRQNNEKIEFTPIPMTYKELYQSLFDAHMVAPFYLKPLQPLFPKWYDANAQYGGIGKMAKMDVSEVKTHLKRVWKEMARRGLVTSNTEGNDDGMENCCEFHHKEGYKIQECEGFRVVIHGLMDSKEIEFYEEVTEKEYICASESVSSVPRVNYPMVIISRPKNEARVQVTPKIIIQKPAFFSYKDSKRVPWNYDCNVTISGKESSVSPLKEDQHIGSHTSNGRRYDLTSARTEPVKGKYLMIEQKKGKAVELEVPVNEPRALMKMLNETYVTNDISINKLDRLVNNISADNFIFCNDDEIPPGGMGSTKALHITTRCKGYMLLEVLVDNGSALNVLSLSTLNRLLVDSSHMKGCQNIVRPFDGTERRVMGRI
ncbi:uncharacterized protein [Gossypium hirsutum]|uniref:Uncharacterized protein n=1 Tax=Gossypium hirsutum TaxID=3635 RepID=A0ABM3BJE1_GOSHI|nr:uncharacterized protein LOC121228103 [Gossypium hirsutum]